MELKFKGKKQEMLDIANAVAFTQIEKHQGGHKVIVIDDNVSVSEIKKKYSMIYEKDKLVIVKPKEIKKQHFDGKFRGRIFDNVILEKTLDVESYKKLMGYVAPLLNILKN